MRVWRAALLLGIAGWALSRWTTPDRAPDTPPAGAVADIVAAAPTRARTPATAIEPDPSSTLLPGAEYPSPTDAPTLGFDATRYLAALPERLDALAQRAKAGEPRALTELAEWMDYCSAAGGVGSRSRHTPSASGDLADTAIANYFQQAATLCTDWMARHRWLLDIRDEVAANARQRLLDLQARMPLDAAAPGSVGEVLRRRAADAGDLIAAGLTNDGDVHERCGGAPADPAQTRQLAYLQCIHTRARQRLSTIFAEHDPQVLEAVPRIVGAMKSGSQTSLALLSLFNTEYLRAGQLPETEVRWILAACRFGLDCGPTGRALRWACVQGACGYRHYRDYAADRLLPPASMRRVEGQVQRLVALILAGDVDGVLGPPPHD